MFSFAQASFVFLAFSLFPSSAHSEMRPSLCEFAEKREKCAPLEFKLGLPPDDLVNTLERIEKFLIDDFRFYVLESHGPFSDSLNPTIDYEVNFLSAVHDSSAFGTTKFIIILSKTTVSPFGIIALKSDGSALFIEVSPDRYEYSILDHADGLILLYRELISGSELQYKLY